MSYIKSDSVFSYTKNSPYQQQIRPNDSTSNIFRSIFQNIPTKPRSILVQSLLNIDGYHYQQNQSLILMERLVTAGYRENPLNTFHCNWAVCKNQGVSQEEDNSEPQDQKVVKNQIYSEVKQEPKSIEQNLQHSSNQLPPTKKIKNETKNIPKNYGKAIISFIEKNKPKIQKITQSLNVDFDFFLEDLKKKKKTINTIADLRTIWSKYEYAKCMRIITCLFLRKYALPYIFDSRICTFTSHIKYRQRLGEAVSNPQDFMHIKDY